MKQVEYSKMPTENGRMVRLYLKPHDEDIISKAAFNLNISPSQALREILASFENSLFEFSKFIKKEEINEDGRKKMQKNSV